MLVILKIPVVYLCAVVWWAIRAEPRPGDEVAVTASLQPSGPCGWRDHVRRRAPQPRPGGARPLPVRRVALLRAGGRS